MKNNAHYQRVRQELKSAGISAYSMLKLESRGIHQVIEDGESIRAAARA